MNNQSDAPLRAYSVQGDEYGCVIFASSNIAARRVGASELGIEFNQVTSCCRMPEADRFAEQRAVPVKVLVEEFGWWQECAYCASMISAEESPDRAWEGDHIFCDTNCQQKFHEREARAKQERASVAAKLEEVKALAISRFPGITNVQVFKEWETGHRVYFDFPGGMKSASWLVGDDNINVCECDVEAGKAFMELVRSAKATDVEATAK